MNNWQSINTAPKDGTHILCYLPYGQSLMIETWWHVDERNGLWFHEDGEVCPTHWMPLPKPPIDLDDFHIVEQALLENPFSACHEGHELMVKAQDALARIKANTHDQ